MPTTVAVHNDTHKRLKDHYNGPDDSMNAIIQRALDALEERD